MWNLIEIAAIVIVTLAIDWAFISFFSLADEYPLRGDENPRTASQASRGRREPGADQSS
jgi:hypothetical protein